jgi:LuxR family maltose regulon positive regulatory protein
MLPFLKTKLYVPPLRENLVSRPRLVERLNEGLRWGRKLTLVSAPAGYGKTTLLSAWVRQVEPPMRVAWLSLDERDNDPLRFWAYVVAALQAVRAGIGDAALAMLHSAQPPPIEAVLTALINEIAAGPAPSSPPPAGCVLALVLDDYHLVESQAIHNTLTFLLDHLPAQLHLVIASRSDPPLPLGRLRGRNQVTELRQADLCFTASEAAAFLNHFDQVTSPHLSARDVAALQARTEGWIAGLQMAAIAMQSYRSPLETRPPPAPLPAPGRHPGEIGDFVRAFTASHRFVLDYLTDEVLSRQPQERQTFLLRTAILDRLAGPLCDAVTGQGNGQQTLEQLEAANLFVVPLDDERRWYRYHQLFAELLRERLERAGVDPVPLLQRRASEWYERNGLIAEAVRYALASGDVERVARLVGGHALALMEHGELRALQGWLDALPEEIVRSHPWLCIAQAWMSAFTGQLDAVEPLLRGAQEAASSRQSSPQGTAGQGEGPYIAGYIAAIRTHVASVRGNTQQAAGFAREALEHLPADDWLARGWATMALGINLGRGGDLAAGDRALSEAVVISRSTGDSHVAVLALCNLAASQTHKGQLFRAAGTFREALQLAGEYARRVGQPLPVGAYAHIGLADVLCEWNELEAALAHVQEGVSVASQWGEPELLSSGYAHLAQIRLAVGDVDGALDAFHKARQTASTLSPWYANRWAPIEALIYLQQGDVAAAARWLAAHKNGLAEGLDTEEQRWGGLIAARVDLVQGRLDQALARATRLCEAAEVVGAVNDAIASLILQALILQEQGQVEQALAALEHALARAAPGGHVRAFVDVGAPMGALLRQAAARGIAPDYVAQLLAALEGQTGSERPAERPAELGRTVSVPIEPLTERELEVLRLLAAGMSNREIARALYLSVNTIKHHTKGIYGKLDVHTRLQAVSRAQELGML